MDQEVPSASPGGQTAARDTARARPERKASGSTDLSTARRSPGQPDSQHGATGA